MTKNLKRFFLFNIFAILLTVNGIYAENPENKFNRVRTYDVQHYLIKTEFDRKGKRITAETTVSFKPLVENFKTIELDAVGLAFESVKLIPENIDLKYKQVGEKLVVSLNKTYSQNDLISIQFKYKTKPKKAIYFVDPYKRNGEVIRESQVWTQGEPEEIRHWFPSYDFPDDKATTEQYLTVEKGETAIANGKLINIVENEDETKTFHFKMNQPHSVYLTSFVIGTYKDIKDSYNGIPLGYFVYPNQTEIVPLAYGRTKDMFSIFEELTKIKYPFDKYDQTMVASFAFGGMENVTATTMADTEILAVKFPFARDNVEDLVSHELAHSWFGNLVTCRNWAELWLNEGFATFMEAAFREKKYGRDDYIRKIKENAEQFIIDDTYNKKRHGLFNQIADPKNDSTMFDTTTYQKGGAVVHTLREEIGDEAFWNGINIYLERHKFGNVETPDLQKAIEEASNEDLDWFFKQWIYGGGLPKLRVKKSFDAKMNTLKLSFSQTQKRDGLTPSVFILPLEIEIQTESGVKKEIVRLSKRSETFIIQLDGKPSEIKVDPNEKIPIKTVKWTN